MVPWLCGYFIQPAAQGAGTDDGNHGFICHSVASLSWKARLGCNTEQNNTAADVLFQVYHKELLLIPAQQMNAIKRKLLSCYLVFWSYRAARLLAEPQSKPEEGTWGWILLYRVSTVLQQN